MVAEKNTLNVQEIQKNGIGLEPLKAKLRFKVLCIDVKDKNYLLQYRQNYKPIYCEVERNHYVFSYDMLQCLSKCLGGRTEQEKEVLFYTKVHIVDEFHDDVHIEYLDNRVEIDFAFDDYSNQPVTFQLSALSFLKSIYWCSPSSFLELPKPNLVRFEYADTIIQGTAKECIKQGYRHDYGLACKYAVLEYCLNNIEKKQPVTDAEKWHHHYQEIQQ